MELEKLVASGKELGLRDAELREWVKSEQDRLRDERAAEREALKAAADLERAKQESLRLSLRLQEGAQNSPQTEGSVVAQPHVVPALSTSPHNFIPPFDARRDDLDAYLLRFERVAAAQKWPEDKWAVGLSTCLTGDALSVIGRMTPEDSLDYEKVKLALLQRFRFTPQGYNDKFRQAKPEDGETGTQFVTRLSGYFDRWLETSGVPKTFEALRDKMIAEQFSKCCSSQLAIFIKERDCKSTKEIAEACDRFLEAQALTNLGKARDEKRESQADLQSKKGRTCFICGKTGHCAPDCRMAVRNVRCENCGRQGHKTQNCRSNPPNKKQVSACTFAKRRCKTPRMNNGGKGKLAPTRAVREECEPQTDRFIGSMPVATGQVYGRLVSVLRDTGSNTVIVRRELVPDRCLTGQASTVLFVDNTTRHLEEAYIFVNTPYFTGHVLAKCMADPLYDLILGNIPGVRDPNNPNPTWQPQVSEPSVLVEDAGVEVLHSPADRKTDEVQEISAVKQGIPTSSITIADVTRRDMIQKQQKDRTLDECFKKVGTEFFTRSGNAYTYVQEKGLLYRRYCLASGQRLKQLVIPHLLREAVMKMAHEGIMSGHQGTRSTTERILREFYWPGIYADVKRFVKSCDVCQRTTPKGKVGVAPLGNMPIIETPFQRVAVDIIGPLRPASEKGNRYILTMVDFATRYADAVALPNIDSVHVAEGLLEMFSRVGFPKEILTDRGTSFTSGLMEEVNRLLSMKSLHTTPFHAMGNGMVEKYNGTLKTMLRRMCREKPKCWDRYLAPLLFAYREVPQASLGFSPFELIYGRHVRGPMAVLRELWTEDGLDENIRSTYTYLVELRNRLEETCKTAHEELRKAKVKQKAYYDRRAVRRPLRPGDRVLVLLPSSTNKLIMQWKGPFAVLRQYNDADYEIDAGGKTKLFHINMLKKYEERQPISAFVAAVNIIEDGTDSEEIPFFSAKQEQTFEDICVFPGLTPEQRQQVHSLCSQFHDIFSDLPGKTDLVECKLNVTSATPVHVRQYPVPFAFQEPIENEVQDMLRLGVIERSTSPYNAPLLAIRKPDNTIRVCVDFRELNKLLLDDSEPIPRIDVLLAEIGPKNVFSKFDFTKGYWQVPMAQDSREKTAFSCRSGLYQFKYMPFGLKTAPAVYARLMRKVFAGIPNTFHYFDDVLVATETWEEHLAVLRTVFTRIREAKLTIKPRKSEIGSQTVTFLGHKIGQSKVEPMDKTLDKILGSRRPQNKKQVRSFLGLTGYYRQFIPSYAEIAKPLTDLTRKSSKSVIEWTEDLRFATKVILCTNSASAGSSERIRTAHGRIG